ncbi:MAG: hypothetical protein K0R94_927 [Burkholderiales bacterium]|jgi:glutathione S-transferase|nr:hypothetical protein [Burkholderiales bacterium]
MNDTVLFIIPGACSFGSMVALELIGKPYKIGITTAQIRKSDAFLKINPLGKVGALLDNGNVIYENSAIIMYLVDNNPQSKIFMPLESKDRIEAYKWLSYLSSNLHVSFGPLFRPEAFIDEANIPQLREFAIKKLNNIFEYIDNYLSKNAFLFSKEMTVIDAQAYGILRFGNKFNLLDNYKNIQAYLDRMNQISVIQNALNIEQQKIELLKNSSFAGYWVFE